VVHFVREWHFRAFAEMGRRRRWNRSFPCQFGFEAWRSLADLVSRRIRAADICGVGANMGGGALTVWKCAARTGEHTRRAQALSPLAAFAARGEERQTRRRLTQTPLPRAVGAICATDCDRAVVARAAPTCIPRRAAAAARALHIGGALGEIVAGALLVAGRLRSPVEGGAIEVGSAGVDAPVGAAPLGDGLTGRPAGLAGGIGAPGPARGPAPCRGGPAAREKPEKQQNADRPTLKVHVKLQVRDPLRARTVAHWVRQTR
jgi:hypothetical protein